MQFKNTTLNDHDIKLFFKHNYGIVIIIIIINRL